jgi:hypothetical protein
MLQDCVEKSMQDLLRFIITQASRREQNGEINGRKRSDPKLKNLTNSLPTVPRPFTTVARLLYYDYYCQPPRPRFPDLDHLLMGCGAGLSSSLPCIYEAFFFWTKSFFSKTENTRFHACPAMLCFFSNFVS